MRAAAAAFASGPAKSRSKVPLVRSRKVATLVTTNITTNGKTPKSAGPIRSKTGAVSIGGLVRQLSALPPIMGLLDDRSLTGRAFCDAYSGVMDDWLQALWTDAVADLPGAGAG